MKELKELISIKHTASIIFEDDIYLDIKKDVFYSDTHVNRLLMDHNPNWMVENYLHIEEDLI